MNILIDIGHPCHIHLFRNFYTFMKDKHKVIVTIYQMKVLEDLCKAYKIDYVIKGRKYRSLIGKAYGILQHSLRLRMLIRKEKINMAIGVSATISLASLFSKTKSIILDDDDSNVQPLMAKYFHPLANTVLSPDVLKYENKKNAIYHSSYHELAYLHPHNFTPDDSVKRILQKDKKHYFILRFNAFVAHHDVGVSGLTLKQKKEIADLLANWGNVYISTEKEIDSELKKYKFPLSSDKMHSALYYADTYIGDSQTMATEAAVLGTMTFRCNSLANSLSLINEVSDKYGLVNNYLPQDFDQMLKDLKDFLNNSKRDIMKINRERLLKDKIDFSKFLIWFVENYPESLKIMKHNPDYQSRFKLKIQNRRGKMSYTIASIKRVKVDKIGNVSMFLEPAVNYKGAINSKPYLLALNSDMNNTTTAETISISTEFKLGINHNSIAVFLPFWLEKKSLLKFEFNEYNSKLIESIEMYEDDEK